VTKSTSSSGPRYQQLHHPPGSFIKFELLIYIDNCPIAIEIGDCSCGTFPAANANHIMRLGALLQLQM
jgi:hypothetical protein